MIVRVRLTVHGQVQGVSFRWYAQQRARSLGLSGWVRNCPDGTVSVVAQGDEQSVDQFVAWAREGPAAAIVERVDIDHETPQASENTFTISG